MQGLVLYIIFCFLGNIFSYEYDYKLSKKLHTDYKKLITKTSIGKEFYFKKFNKIEKPLILLRYSDDIGFAWYDPKKNTITFNTKYIMIFFDISRYDDKKIIEVFYFSDKTRKEFISYTDTIFFHEMIHAYQSKTYPSLVSYRNNFFVELEYEAYFLSDIYFFEKVKNNKKLFLKIISNNYIDLYTADAINGFFSLITDLNQYQETIKKRYQKEIEGYVSLSDEEKKRKAKIEEKKFLSYVVGKKDISLVEEIKLNEIKKLKHAYQKSVFDFFEKKYKYINCNALSYTIESSFKVKNYYLIFKGGYYFIKNLCKMDDKIYKILDNSQKDFINWLFINKDKVFIEDLYLTLKSYDEYMSILKKEISSDILNLRDDVYIKMVIDIKNKLKIERDEIKREEYISELDFLYRKLGRKAIEGFN